FLIYFLRRNTDPFNSVVLVFTVMLLNQPLYIYDPSFIMSFLCVYGIVVGFMNWGWIFEKFDLIKFKSSDGRLFVFLKMTLRRSIRAIVSIFLMTIFSQMMLFPYVSTHFYRFSLVSYLSNLILIPFSSAVMSVSVLWSFLRFFTDLTFADTLVELSVNGFINMVYYFSSFKYSMIYFSLPNSVSVISITLLILTLLHLPIFDFSKPWSKLWFFLVFIFLIFSFSTRTPVGDDINLKAKHKDVWYIERNGEYFIVDPILDADKIINAVYASRRNRVDYIVISSYKTFRKKTLLKLIETFKVKKVIMPIWICEKDIPADCIFGGEERNGFYAEFYDNYGYHNIYSRLRFCFKDRCF
ncbi:MAG: ComEC/Rec2 family competence protein, partial [Elusimicrobiales bacterium]